MGGTPEVLALFHRDIVQDTAGEVTAVEFQIAVLYLAPGLLPDLHRDGDALTAMTRALAGFQPPRATGLSHVKRVGSMVPQTWAEQSIVAYGMLFSTSGVL